MTLTYAGQYGPMCLWPIIAGSVVVPTALTIEKEDDSTHAALFTDRTGSSPAANASVATGVTFPAPGLDAAGNLMFFAAMLKADGTPQYYKAVATLPGGSTVTINGLLVMADAEDIATAGSIITDGVGQQWKLTVDNTGNVLPVLLNPPTGGGGSTGGTGPVVPPTTTTSTTTFPDGTLDNTNDAGTGTNQFEYVGSGGSGIGSWTTAYPTGGKSTTEHYTFTPGDFLRYRLPIGRTGITFIGELGPGQGKVDVTVDGVSVGSAFDMYSATTQAGATLFHLSGIDPSAAHTIVATVDASKNSSSAGFTFAVEQAIPEVTTTTSTPPTSFNTDGLAFTAFDVTPSTGDETVLRTCTYTITASKAVTLQDTAGAVRTTVNPVDSSDLDFPHATAAITFAAGDSKTFTTTRLFAAGSYNVNPAYNIGGVWSQDTDVLPLTVSPASAAATGTNPVGTGVKSGLTWSSGMWGTGAPSGEAANRAIYEAGRGRAGDLVGAVAVGGDWGSIEGLSTLSLMPHDRPAIIDVVPWPGSANTWQDAANGTLNSHYFNMGATAANSATNGGHPVVIRFAWEFNFGSVDGVSPATFAAAWANMYNQAKAGAGAHPERVIIDWSIGGLANANGQSVFNYYPGDAVVDIIGVDNYDFNHDTTQAAFDGDQAALYNTVYNFAQQHGKLMALDEWGGAAVNGNSAAGDNAFYIQAMYAWIRAHKAGLAYEMYFQNADANNVNNALFTPTLMPLEKARYALEVTAG